MRIKVLTLVAVLIFVIAGFSGCGGKTDVVSNLVGSVAQALSGDVTGEIGKTYKTKWFDFTIHSIEKVDSYAGYSAPSGYQLYSVQVTEKNTFDEAIPMGTFDFYMDDPSFMEYIWAIDPLDNTMMPDYFDLNPGETVQYYMIFEIPTDVTELMLMYTEIDDSDNEHNTFTIHVK